MSKFDFSRFAYKPDQSLTEDSTNDLNSNLPPKIERKKIDDSEEEEDFKTTKSGRRIQSKAKTYFVDSASSSSEDENDEDVFKVRSTKPPRKLNLGREKPKRINKPKIVKNEHDITVDFVPLRKVNRSITINTKFSQGTSIS